MAKARVAPVKVITIPRLELIAAVTSVKISELLNRELTYSNIKNVYWTDSKVVLGYIGNEAKRFHVFVANLIQQIHDRSSVKEWHYVATTDNPADIASRGITADGLVQCQLWWRGPKFLSSHDLPLQTEAPSISTNDPEIRKTIIHSTVSEQHNDADLLSRLNYFSDWHRARKAVALCRRYIIHLKDKVSVKSYEPVSVREIQNAEQVVLQAVQQKYISACYVK